MSKPDVDPLFRERWSPYVFDRRDVEPEKIDLLFQAARLAPSCYNEQPWSFVLGFRNTEGYTKIISTFVDFNKSWASQAPVLGISVANTKYKKNQKPNRHAYHDVGLAMGSLILQAVKLDLAVHQMGGFDHERAAHLLNFAPDHEAVAAFAIGYVGDTSSADPELAEKDQARRPRKEMREMLFEGEWGHRWEI